MKINLTFDIDMKQLVNDVVEQLDSYHGDDYMQVVEEVTRWLDQYITDTILDKEFDYENTYVPVIDAVAESRAVARRIKE